MLKRCAFNRLSIGMIPKSYRESLTYEEQILWLQKYVNDMLEWLTKLQEDFDNIDLNFEELEEKINVLRNDLDSLSELVNTKASKEELNTGLENLEALLRDLITNDYNILKEYVDTQDEYLQYEIDHFDIDKIKVYDPTTGLESDIQTVIDNIYDQTRTEAITAGEFDLLLLSATEFDSKELTAFNFDRYGKTLLEE